MTTRRAWPVPVVILTSWNDTRPLKAFAGGLPDSRLICPELTGARSEGVRPSVRAGLEHR